MQLQQMRYILEIHRHGSFSRAAKALFIAQPTLSQQVAALEKELQVELFIRHRRGVALTDAGKEFVSYARKITNEIDNLLDSMHSFASLAKGQVKIGVLWIFADVGLPELLSAFQDLHPQLETSILVDGSVKLMEMLVSREVDAIFYIGAEQMTDDEELHTIGLYSSDMMLVIPVEHPLARQDEVHISHLHGQNIVLPAKDSSIYGPLAGQFHAYHVVPKVIAQSSQTDVMLSCAKNGMAISFVSDSIARTHIDERVVIRPLYPVIKREIYFSVLQSTLVIPAVRILTEYMEEHFPTPQRTLRKEAAAP